MPPVKERFSSHKLFGEEAVIARRMRDGTAVLSAQADAFIPQKLRDGEERTGVRAEEKVGLLRSE
jgi:hypothetical protein